MTTPFTSLLNKYKCKTKDDYIHAFHEIIQEIALIGLSRTNFFDIAAFYGGTALRILYGLDRFSEDLDFSLLSPQKKLDLHSYLKGAEDELTAFGLKVKIERKIKHPPSPILSAFLKVNTLETFILVDLPEMKNIFREEHLKIKFEVDSDPPPDFKTEVKYLLTPISFSVRSYVPSDLFAGKMCALLFREWKVRIKGRDWYDFIWFVSHEIPLHLAHLEARMRQSGYWKESRKLTPDIFQALLRDKIERLDLEMAKSDILPFVEDRRKIAVWSKPFFLDLVPKISYL